MSPLELVQRGGRVLRYHTVPVARPENVAEHSFYVAWICWYVERTTPSAALLLAALSHDLPEQELGDMPGQTKQRLGLHDAFLKEETRICYEAGMPHYERLVNTRERIVLKFADLYAGYMKCQMELTMGNRYITGTLGRYMEMIRKHIVAHKEVLDTQEVRELMDDAEGAIDVS